MKIDILYSPEIKSMSNIQIILIVSIWPKTIECIKPDLHKQQAYANPTHQKDMK